MSSDAVQQFRMRALQEVHDAELPATAQMMAIMLVGVECYEMEAGQRLTYRDVLADSAFRF